MKHGYGTTSHCLYWVCNALMLFSVILRKRKLDRYLTSQYITNVNKVALIEGSVIKIYRYNLFFYLSHFHLIRKSQLSFVLYFHYICCIKICLWNTLNIYVQCTLSMVHHIVKKNINKCLSLHCFCQTNLYFNHFQPFAAIFHCFSIPHFYMYKKTFEKCQFWTHWKF